MRGKIDEIPLILFKLITTKSGAGKGKSERGEGSGYIILVENLTRLLN